MTVFVFLLFTCHLHSVNIYIYTRPQKNKNKISFKRHCENPQVAENTNDRSDYNNKAPTFFFFKNLLTPSLLYILISSTCTLSTNFKLGHLWLTVGELVETNYRSYCVDLTERSQTDLFNSQTCFTYTAAAAASLLRVTTLQWVSEHGTDNTNRCRVYKLVL